MAYNVIDQVMAKTHLTKESEFVVVEEKILNYILATLCFALFVYGLVDAARRHFTKIDYQSFFFALALIPAYLFFKKARSNRVYIRVNKNGIYQDEKLVTGWANLLNAHIAQKEKTGIFNIQDNFLLVLEYKKSGFQQGFRHKIPLTNTQNKSEEEVLEAVHFFWKEFRKEAGI
jgi:hypothetical protein